MEECLGNYAIVLTGMKRDTEKEFLLMLHCARQQSSVAGMGIRLTQRTFVQRRIQRRF